MDAKGSSSDSNGSHFEIVENLQYCYPTCQSQHGLSFPCKHRLDLFLPQRSNSTTPVVIFVHGGSWMRGDKKAYRHFSSFYGTNLLVAVVLMYYDLYWNVGRAFARSGIACAVISYRLSKLELPWVLFRLLISLLLSTTLVLTPLVCITLFTLLLSSYLSVDFESGVSESASLNDYTVFNSFSFVSFTVLVLVSLCIVWFAVFQSGEGHFISVQIKLAPLLTSLLISVICLVFLEIELHAFFSCFTLCFVVCLVHTFATLQQSYRPSVRHPDHVEDVATSVGWVKTYGQMSKRFNPRNIFLCGHSAGGHLASLAVTESSYLHQVGLSFHDIKGVISISGVYNLSRLSGWIMERVLLKPVFGDDPGIRRNASPFFCLDREDNLSKIPFLVLNAEYDFSLKEDAKNFVLKLKQLAYPYEFHVVKGTNHFSIILGFDSPTRYLETGELRSQLVEKLCIDFVRKHSCY